jgi:hypothetical protein
MKGSPLTNIERVTVVAPLDAEASLVHKTALLLQDVIAAARQNLSDEEIRELEELITEYGEMLHNNSEKPA